MTGPDWQQRLRRALSRTLRPVQFWTRRNLLLLVDLLAMQTPVNPETNRVLLVRADHIGDFVLWLDIARTLVDHYRSQGKQVTLLGNSAWAVWAKQLAIFDVVLPLEPERYKKDLRYRLHMGKQLRRLGFGTAIHAALTRVPEVGDSLVHVSNAPERLGPCSERRATATDAWYTRLINATGEGELRKSASFASGVLGTPYKARVANLRAMAKIDRPNAFPHGSFREPYFVLFPGASHPGRKWPAQNLVALARKIHGYTGWKGVVCGGPGDAADAASIVAEAGSLLQSLAGQTNLGQLAEVIAGAQLLVSNETSAVHIAAALGIPSVCILGGGHFRRFVPYDIDVTDDRPLPRFAVHAMPCFGCNWTCKFHPRRGEPMPCVKEVTVDAVWQEVQSSIPEREQLRSPFRVLRSSRNPTKEQDAVALVGI